MKTYEMTQFWQFLKILLSILRLFVKVRYKYNHSLAKILKSIIEKKMVIEVKQ